MKNFNELPVKIQRRMLECQVEQGNPADSGVFMKQIDAIKENGGFDWFDTLEGHIAWSYAITNDYYRFLYRANPDLIP